jgi:hypothetical protein
MKATEIKNARILTDTKKDFSIQWECIEQVYDGQLNSCACGCQGDYLYTKHYTDIRNVGRKPNVMLHPSDEVIKRILDEMSRSHEVGFQKDNNGWILELHTETKDNWEGDEMEIGYRIYFKNRPLEHKKA